MTSQPSARFGRTVRRLLATVLVAVPVVGVVAPIAGPVAPAAAAVGVPAAPVLVWSENFENGLGTAPSALNYNGIKYTGTGGNTYYGSPLWVNPANCNGLLIAGQTTTVAASQGQVTVGGATCSSADPLRQLAVALGNFNGTSPANTNHAVAAFTAGNPGAGWQARLEQLVTLPGSANRFISVSVIGAALNCGVGAPSYLFYRSTDLTNWTAIGTAVNGCSGSTFSAPALGQAGAANGRIGRYYAPSAWLNPGSQFAVGVSNQNGSGVGNDAAFDDLSVWDVSPQMEKSFAPTSIAPGAPSTLTFTITNTSELGGKAGWSFTDTLPTGLVVANPTGAATTCPSTTFAPTAGATSVTVSSGTLSSGMTSCTVTVKVTAAADGSYTNSDSNITSAVGLNKPTVPSTLVVSTPVPRLTVTKTASPTAMVLGETVRFTISAKNTGNVVLTNVTVSDPGVSGLTCSPATPVASLAVGASVACQGTRVVSQTDIDNGTFTNTAAASAGSSAGSTSGQASATITATKNPSLAVDKSVSPTSFTAAGQVLSYQVRVTNTGNVTLNNVSVSDPGVTNLVCTPASPATKLAPGAQILCSASRVTTDADVLAGGVQNTASATGTPTGGSPVTGTDTAAATGPPPDPELALTKTGSPATFDAVGDRVTFTLTTVNTGNVPISDVTVNDPSVSDLTCSPALPVASLAVGGRIVCQATRTVTQADVDNGEILNAATASGRAPDGSTTNDSASAEVPGPVAEPSLSLSKTAAQITYSKAGDSLDYTLVATNTGNVTLTGVTISDPSIETLSCSPSLPVPSLAPGAKITCTGTRPVTQAEVDAGSATNTATASGTTPGLQPIDTDASHTVVGLPAVPRMVITKSANPSAFVEIGDVITYRITLSNTGTATLRDIVIDDPMGTPVCSPSLSGLSLAPGGVVECSYTHEVTALDATVGNVVNTATVDAESLLGSLTSDATTLITPGPVPEPKLSVLKTADVTAFGGVGDTVTFTIVTTNIGNVPLTGVDVTDPMIDLSCDQSLPAADLDIGASITCTGSYQVTQDDVDAGTLSNAASAVGADLLGNPVEAASLRTLSGPAAAPSLDLDKQVSPSVVHSAGQVITYTFVVTNTGNVTVRSMNIVDPVVGPVLCGTTTLRPGQRTTCEITRLATQADIDGGSLVNTATASGSPVRGQLPTSVDTAELQSVRNPALAVTKAVSPGTFSRVDEPLRYTVTVTNTGNVTLSNIAVSDPRAPMTCAPAEPITLAPGAAAVCVGTARVTALDADTGSLSNTATASADAPGGERLSESATRVTDGPVPDRRLSLTKTANPSVFSHVGQVVTFTLVATNTGNVPLSDVTMSDQMLDALTCPAGTSVALSPGQQYSCTGTHVVTQAELDSGTISNSAAVTGRSPTGAPVSDTAGIEVPGLPPVPELSLVKVADPPAFSALGDTVTWTVVVTNTGTATLSGVDATDDLGELVCDETLPRSGFAPGESFTCTFSKVVDEYDIAAGSILNRATATALDRDGNEISANDTVLTDGPAPDPRLSVVKTSSLARYSEVGQVLVFTVTVTNTGNVPISDVTVDDPGFDLVCDETLPMATLAVGAKITCTTEVEITQSLVDEGLVRNEASASGTDPLGGTVGGQDSVDVVGPAAAPSLELTKSTPAERVTWAGQVLTFTFVVVNTGNVTIAGVGIVDPLLDAPAVCITDTLAPGERTTCTGSATVKVAEMAGRYYSNTASAAGTASRQSFAAPYSSVEVPVSPEILPPTL